MRFDDDMFTVRNDREPDKFGRPRASSHVSIFPHITTLSLPPCRGRDARRSVARCSAVLAPAPAEAAGVRGRSRRRWHRSPSRRSMRWPISTHVDDTRSYDRYALTFARYVQAARRSRRLGRGRARHPGGDAARRVGAHRSRQADGVARGVDPTRRAVPVAPSEPGVGFDCSGLTAYAWGVAGQELARQSRAQINALDARRAHRRRKPAT